MISSETFNRIEAEAKKMRGGTIHELAETCGVHYRTASRVVHDAAGRGELFLGSTVRNCKKATAIGGTKESADLATAGYKEWSSGLKAAKTARHRDYVRSQKRIKDAEAKQAQAAEKMRKDAAKVRAKLEKEAKRKAELIARETARIKARVARPTTAAPKVVAARGPAGMPGELDLSGAKITIAKTPPGRYEFVGRVLDGFSTMRLGCYEVPAMSCAAKAA